MQELNSKMYLVTVPFSGSRINVEPVPVLGYRNPDYSGPVPHVPTIWEREGKSCGDGPLYHAKGSLQSLKIGGPCWLWEEAPSICIVDSWGDNVAHLSTPASSFHYQTASVGGFVYHLAFTDIASGRSSPFISWWIARIDNSCGPITVSSNPTGRKYYDQSQPCWRGLYYLPRGTSEVNSEAIWREALAGTLKKGSFTSYSSCYLDSHYSYDENAKPDTPNYDIWAAHKLGWVQCLGMRAAMANCYADCLMQCTPCKVNSIANIGSLFDLVSVLLNPRKFIRDSSLRIKTFKQLVKLAANAELTYEYLYKTTLGDLQGYKKAINKIAYYSKATTVRRTSSCTYNGGTLRCTVEFSASDFLPQNVRDDLRQIGVSLSATNMWDLVPYSFVVDWFIHLDELFQDLDVLEMARTRCYQPLSVWFTFKTSNEFVRWSDTVTLSDMIWYSEDTDGSPLTHWVQGSALIIQRL